MRKENNGLCKEKNKKLCKVKACRKTNLQYENGFLVAMSALHRVSKTKFSFEGPKSVCLKNIFKITHIDDLVWARESDCTSFIARHSSIIIFHDGLFNIEILNITAIIISIGKTGE